MCMLGSISQLGIQSIFGARSPPGQSWAGTVLRGIPLTLMKIVHHFKRHWKQFEFDNMDVAIWTMVAICARGLNSNPTEGERKEERENTIEVKNSPRIADSWFCLQPSW